MQSEPLDFTATFARLAASGDREQTMQLGGIDVRLVRLPAGSAGNWDHHQGSTETVVVWSGAFTVDFRDHTLELAPGQCCVVPVAAEHRGSTTTGAEIVLFQRSAPAP